MKNIFLLFSALITLVYSSISFASSTLPLIANENPGVGKILIVGDSLAAGYKATSAKVTPYGCLKKYFAHSKMINIAVPGLTSEQILKTVDKVLSQKPKLVFVSSGGNDTLKDDKEPGSYPPEKTFEEMHEMFDKLLATGAVVAYLGLNPPAPYPIRLPEIWNIAAAKGVIVVDGMNGFWTDPTLMADPHHPNNAGYAIMCSRMVQDIKDYYP